MGWTRARWRSLGDPHAWPRCSGRSRQRCSSTWSSRATRTEKRRRRCCVRRRGDAPDRALVSSFEPATLDAMRTLLPGWRRWLNAEDLGAGHPVARGRARLRGRLGAVGRDHQRRRSGARPTRDWRSRRGRCAAPRQSSGSAGWVSSRAASRAGHSARSPSWPPGDAPGSRAPSAARDASVGRRSRLAGGHTVARCDGFGRWVAGGWHDPGIRRDGAVPGRANRGRVRR